MNDETREKAKPKKYLTTRYAALKADTEKAKALLDAKNGTQAAIIYRAIHGAKVAPTFAEVLEKITPQLKGKKAKTIADNARWYLGDLKKKGMLKAVESREARAA